jgi:hypothetical protein
MSEPRTMYANAQVVQKSAEEKAPYIKASLAGFDLGIESLGWRPGVPSSRAPGLVVSLRWKRLPNGDDRPRSICRKNGVRAVLKGILMVRVV